MTADEATPMSDDERLWERVQRLPAAERAVVVALIDVLADDGDNDALDRVQVAADAVSDRCGAIVRKALRDLWIGEYRNARDLP